MLEHLFGTEVLQELLEEDTLVVHLGVMVVAVAVAHLKLELTILIIMGMVLEETVIPQILADQTLNIVTEVAEVIIILVDMEEEQQH